MRSERSVRSPQSPTGVCLLCDTVGLDAGTERQVIETAKRLDRNSFDVHVCCLEPSPQLSALEGQCRTGVFPATSVNSWNGMRQALQLRRYLDLHHIRIVHAYMNKTAIFAVLSSMASDRIVITSRLNTGYWYTPAWRAFFHVLNLGTNRIMANSQQAKNVAVAAECIDARKVDVIYQGVDMSIYRKGLGDATVCEHLGIPASSRVVGIVANLRPVKDLPLFLRAARLVTPECNDVAFLLVGHGDEFEELQHLVQQLGLSARVFFTHGRGRVMDYLARMSIGCLTSQSEGFSNAILEYMAAGLPVVATDVGGNREAILDGETGYLVAEHTPEAFAKPVIQLLKNEDQRLRMGSKGFERCQEHFEINRTIVGLEQYYRSLLTTRL